MRRPFILFFTCLLFISSCKDELEESESNVSTNYASSEANPQLSGNLIQSTFIGRVIRHGSITPVAGALVKIGDKTTHTNERGLYLIKDVQVDESFVTIEVNMNGFFAQFKNLKPRSSSDNVVDIELIERTFTGSFQADQGGEINVLNNQGKITFPANAFLNPDGSAYAGPVSVATTYINPTDPNINSYAPGSMLAVQSDDQLAHLTSFGMIKAEMVGSNDQLLKLAEDTSARIEFPIQKTQEDRAQDEIPLWFFDETTGIWREEGIAQRSGNKYIGQVSHFTFWNCDVASRTANLFGFLYYMEESTPFTSNSVKVKMVRPLLGEDNWAYASQNSDGTFFSVIPADEPIDIYLINDVCGAEIFVMTIPPQQNESDFNIGGIGVSDLLEEKIFEIRAQLFDCSGSPASNAVFEYTSENSMLMGLTQADENGNISVFAGVCDDYLLSYMALDFNEWGDILGETGQVNVSSGVEILDLGSVFICDEFNEAGSYLAYMDDMGHQLFHFGNMTGNYTDEFFDCFFIQQIVFGEQENLGTWCTLEPPLSLGPSNNCSQQIVGYIGGFLGDGNKIWIEIPNTSNTEWMVTALEMNGISVEIVAASYSGEADITIRDEDNNVILENEVNMTCNFRFEN